MWKMNLRQALLLFCAIYFPSALASKEQKQRYIDHSSNQRIESSVLHLSEDSPDYRYRKQNILKENPSKRGFLANLANLLSDADMLSKKNNGKSAIGSISSNAALDPTNRPSTGNTKNLIKKPVTNTFEDNQNEPTPSAAATTKYLKIGEKESAPIFALFHGKIVPLGKLPDTSFRKSHMEVSNGDKENVDDKRTGQSGKASSHKNIELHIENREYSRDNKAITSLKGAENIKQEKALTPSQFSRLSSYFHNLETKKMAVETGEAKSYKKDVTGTVKDEVPDLQPSVKNSEFLKHVKSVILDDGKMVTLKGKSPGIEEQAEPESRETSLEKDREKDTERSYAIDSSLLSQLTRRKEETADPVSRTTQSVTLNIDTLKGLLGKTNGGVSLAKLLNKPSEDAVVNTEEEDPGTIEDFAAGGLKKTNEFRAEHHAPPLIWSDELASEAQNMAEHLADVKSLEISSNLEKKGYGENVAKVWANFKTAGDAATNMWYHQSENYHFDDPHLDQNTGQFAQLIWKDSKELGMGVAKSIDDINNKYVYVVALYRPPGNIETTLRDNVLRKGNDTTDVYSTFFKRSSQIKQKGILLPKHTERQSKYKN